jgi:hypothetical protein
MTSGGPNIPSQILVIKLSIFWIFHELAQSGLNLENQEFKDLSFYAITSLIGAILAEML